MSSPHQLPIATIGLIAAKEVGLSELLSPAVGRLITVDNRPVVAASGFLADLWNVILIETDDVLDYSLGAQAMLSIGVEKVILIQLEHSSIVMPHIERWVHHFGRKQRRSFRNKLAY